MNEEVVVQPPLTKEAIATRLRILDMLTSSEGWAYFGARGRMDMERAERAMYESKDPHAMAKHMGAFVALKAMLTWPAREAELLRKRLEEMNR